MWPQILPYLRTIALYLLADLAEIGGGWLVWQWLLSGSTTPTRAIRTRGILQGNGQVRCPMSEQDPHAHMYPFLYTDKGRRWLQTMLGRNWLRKYGAPWLRTKDGQDWLFSTGGEAWLRSDDGWAWLDTLDGSAWQVTEDGTRWLGSPDGGAYLQSRSGDA